jgi:hypothetical protein
VFTTLKLKVCQCWMSLNVRCLLTLIIIAERSFSFISFHFFILPVLSSYWHRKRHTYVNIQYIFLWLIILTYTPPPSQIPVVLSMT